MKTMTIAQTLKAMRLERGMTQQELAMRAGAAVTSVSRIECGTMRPRRYLAKALARALGTGVDALLAGRAS